MESLICVEPGLLEYRDREMPELQRGRAIIKIKRIGICGTDLHAYQGTQPYFSYPRILGHELSGDLLACDDNPVFNLGDKVTFLPYYSCGKCVACKNGKSNCCVSIQVCGVHIDGGMLEYISVPSSSLIPGANLGYEELALVEPLAIGAHGINRAEVQEGETVLIVGAGPIGIAAMEFARLAGGHTIVMDTNESRLEFCRKKLNVNHTINPSTEDSMNALREITSGEMPLVVIDATGNQGAINNGLQYLAHGGRYILIGLQKGDLIFSHPEFHKREATLMGSRNATRKDFLDVIDTIARGLIQPLSYVTHRLAFSRVKKEFENLLKPENRVIKAMIEMPNE
jgi:2-desacetyl-2-hydroxyethyl bacteriochlorophyllide A dehydrogenase